MKTRKVSFGFDADGVIFNKKYIHPFTPEKIGDIATNNTVVDSNQGLWEFILEVCREHPDLVHITLAFFSARQSAIVDRSNSLANDTESYFLAMKKIHEHVKKIVAEEGFNITVELNNLLMPDIYNNREPGYNHEKIMANIDTSPKELGKIPLKIAEKMDTHFFDSSKISYIFAHANESDVDKYYYLDDMDSIFFLNAEFYGNEIGDKFIPSGKEIILCHYEEGEWKNKCYKKIIGKGIKHPRYKDVLKYIYILESTGEQILPCIRSKTNDINVSINRFHMIYQFFMPYNSPNNWPDKQLANQLRDKYILPLLMNTPLEKRIMRAKGILEYLQKYYFHLMFPMQQPVISDCLDSSSELVSIYTDRNMQRKIFPGFTCAEIQTCTREVLHCSVMPATLPSIAPHEITNQAHTFIYDYLDHASKFSFGSTCKSTLFLHQSRLRHKLFYAIAGSVDCGDSLTQDDVMNAFTKPQLKKVKLFYSRYQAMAQARNNTIPDWHNPPRPIVPTVWLVYLRGDYPVFEKKTFTLISTSCKSRSDVSIAFAIIDKTLVQPIKGFVYTEETHGVYAEKLCVDVAEHQKKNESGMEVVGSPRRSYG